MLPHPQVGDADEPSVVNQRIEALRKRTDAVGAAEPDSPAIKFRAARNALEAYSPLRCAQWVQQGIEPLPIVVFGHQHDSPQHGVERRWRDQDPLGWEVAGLDGLADLRRHIRLCDDRPCRIQRRQREAQGIPASSVWKRRGGRLPNLRRRQPDLGAIDRHRIQRRMREQRQYDHQPPAPEQRSGTAGDSEQEAEYG